VSTSLRALIEPASPSTADDRVRAVGELFEAGLELMRARIRREAPSLGEDEVEARLAAWLERRSPVLSGEGFVRVSTWRSGEPLP
jgi:hypothetical protein